MDSPSVGQTRQYSHRAAGYRSGSGCDLRRRGRVVALTEELHGHIANAFFSVDHDAVVVGIVPDQVPQGNDWIETGVPCRVNLTGREGCCRRAAGGWVGIAVAGIVTGIPRCHRCRGWQHAQDEVNAVGAWHQIRKTVDAAGICCRCENDGAVTVQQFDGYIGNPWLIAILQAIAVVVIPDAIPDPGRW